MAGVGRRPRPLSRFQSRVRQVSALFVKHNLRMSTKRAALLDGGLIIAGILASTLFVSTDGNGQNPLPVVAGMLLVVLITGLVSYGLALFIRSVPFAVFSSLVIMELLFILYFVCRVAFSEHVDEHVQEELYLLPLVFAVYTAPTVLLSCIGFGRLAGRVFKREILK